MLGTHPISSYFSPFLYATGTLLAAAPMVVPRVRRFAYVLGPCRPFKWLSWETCSFFHCSNTHWILQSEIVRFCFPGTWALDCTVRPGAGIACSQGIPPIFYSSHMNVRLPILLAIATTASPPLPHCVLSGPTPHFCTFSALVEYGFFKSLVIRLPCNLIFWQFWVFFCFRLVVIFFMVGQGGGACLSMPPSWPEVLQCFEYSVSTIIWTLTSTRKGLCFSHLCSLST